MNNKSITKFLSVALIFAVLVFLFLKVTHFQKKINSGFNLTEIQEVYVDETGKLDINDVINSDSMKFVDYNKSEVSSTIGGVYWVKIDLKNLTDKKNKYLIEIAKPQLGLIDFYQISLDKKIIKTVKTGRNTDFDTREINHRNFIFKIDSNYFEGSIYLRIKADSYLQVPSTLWTIDEFLDVSNTSNIYYGVFYGGLLIMIVFNSVLAALLRDGTYLAYVLFVLSFTILLLIWDGFSYQFLWPNASYWDMISNPLFINFGVLFLLIFNGLFLKVTKSQKFIFYTSFILISLILVNIILIFFISIKLSLYLSMAGVSFVIIISFITGISNRVSRRSYFIYITAWGVFFASNIISILAGLKLLPYSKFLLYSPKIGIVILVVMFSLALADRIQHSEYLRGIESEKGIILKKLNIMNGRLTSTRDIEEVISYLLTDFQDITSFESMILLVEDIENLKLFTRYDAEKSEIINIKLSNEDYEKYKNASGITDLLLDDFFNDIFKSRDEIKSSMVIPLINRDQKMGIILLYSSNVKKYNSTISNMLLDYASQIAITIDNIRLLNKYTLAAERDGLTQIYNRKTLFDKAHLLFDKPLENGYKFAAIMLDLDYFKNVNDIYGHSAGDKVLTHLAKAMKDEIGNKDLFGRYGGEEFIIIMPAATPNEVKTMGELIRVTVENQKIVVNHEKNSTICVTVSVGIAYKNKFTKSVYALTEAADKALYEAKDKGRNLVIESIV